MTKENIMKCLVSDNERYAAGKSEVKVDPGGLSAPLDHLHYGYL